MSKFRAQRANQEKSSNTNLNIRSTEESKFKQMGEILSIFVKIAQISIDFYTTNRQEMTFISPYLTTRTTNLVAAHVPPFSLFIGSVYILQSDDKTE